MSEIIDGYDQHWIPHEIYYVDIHGEQDTSAYASASALSLYSTVNY